MALALYTFGQFLKPAQDAANDGFHALNDPVMASVDAAPGLIARSGYASDDGTAPWGPEIYPRFYRDRGDGWSPATLSLWTDLGAVAAFTYSGLHAAAMRQGRACLGGRGTRLPGGEGRPDDLPVADRQARAPCVHAQGRVAGASRLAWARRGRKRNW